MSVIKSDSGQTTALGIDKSKKMIQITDVSGVIETRIILASSSGYGFIANLGDLQSKNKSGKAAIKVQENAKVLIPRVIQDENDPNYDKWVHYKRRKNLTNILNK